MSNTEAPERKAPTGFIGRKTGPGAAEYTALDTTWQTPEHILECVRAYFGGPIPFDVATAPNNPTKALGFWTKEIDALAQPYWPPRLFCNPPYGKALKLFLARFGEEAQVKRRVFWALRADGDWAEAAVTCGAEQVCVLPVNRTEQAYFANSFVNGSHVCMIRKRVNFIRAENGDAVSGNPYSTMLVGWNTDETRWLDSFKGLGACFGIRKLCESPLEPLKGKRRATKKIPPPPPAW